MPSSEKQDRPESLLTVVIAFAANLLVFQPFAGRVQVKFLPRANGSWWAEAYAGSVLFDGMVGGGVRWQHTAWTAASGDALLVGPGLGIHLIPTNNGWHRHSGTMAFLAGDVDVSWLHDFSPHFGWEFGLKVGLAGRVGGEWYRDSRRPTGQERQALSVAETFATPSSR